LLDIPLNQALKRSARNQQSKWPDSNAENRLEPECWPALNPKFQLTRGSRIFTIGSCFARHIEQYLHQFGFHLPTIRYLETLDGDRVFFWSTLNPDISMAAYTCSVSPTRLLERGKQNPVIFLWLLYSEMQRPGQQDKLELYSRFVEEELPQDINFTLGFAAIYRKERMFAEAEALIWRVLERQPSNLDFLTMLFDVLIKQAKPVEACAALDRILAIDPDNGDAEALTRRWLETEALDLEPSASLLSVLIKYNKTGKAEQILNRFLQADPHGLTGLMRLGDMSLRLGQRASAEIVCRWVLQRNPSDFWAAATLAGGLCGLRKANEA
jgi:tetratricopeptide (TPR) repeat protein